MSRFRFVRITDERDDPAVFGLIGTPKVRIEKKNKLFLSVFKTEMSQSLRQRLRQQGFDRSSIERAKL